MQRELQDLLQYRRYFEAVSHCFREANKPADKLSAVGVEARCTAIYEAYIELPRMVRGDITLDTSGFPNFPRCRG